MNEAEITARIFDEIMQNVGRSAMHTGFPLKMVTDVELSLTCFHFRLNNGRTYKVTVTPADGHFREEEE